MESVELLTAQKVDELRNVVTKELKTNRKITIAGFIIILVIIIELQFFDCVFMCLNTADVVRAETLIID